MVELGARTGANGSNGQGVGGVGGGVGGGSGGHGGGGGLGFDLPHQTLPFDNLELTAEEQQALVAFLKTLTDVPEEVVY